MSDTLLTAPGSAIPEPEVDLAAQATRLGLAVAAVSAATGTLQPGLGLALAFLGFLAAAAMIVGPRTRAGLWCASWVAALPLLVLRDNRWLAICVVATAVAVVVFAFTARATGQSLSDLSLGRIVRRSGPNHLDPSLFPQLSIDGRLWAVLRGLVLAAPVLWVFSALLSSADSVFASLLSFDVGTFSISLLARPVWFLGLAWIAIPLLRFGADRRTSSAPVIVQRVGVTEASIVFGSVSALFALFIASRVASFGQEFSDTMLRDEVRGGFFQLLWVAALSVALVLGLRSVGREALDSVRVRALAALTILLAGVIDALALVRIAGYVRGSFSTPLRVWSFGFGMWLLVVLLIAVARVLGVRGGRRWFALALISSWMGFVVAMGLFNPDEWIATYNFENAPTEPDQFIAVNPLIWLSDDGSEVIIENIDVLRPMPNDRFVRMSEHLCATPIDDSWRDFNFSRSNARDQIEALCGSRTPR